MDVGNVCEVRDDESIPSNLLSWKNSGFSIDASLRLFGSDDKTRESIAQYLVRQPLSLNKITYEPFKGKVLFKTKYNEYFGGRSRTSLSFTAPVHPCTMRTSKYIMEKILFTLLHSIYLLPEFILYDIMDCTHLVVVVFGRIFLI